MISPRKKLFMTLLIPCMAAAFAVSACANNAVPGNTPEPTQLEQNTPAPSEAADTALPGAAPTVVPTQNPTAAPTAEPTPEATEVPDEWFVDKAWSAASRFNELYGYDFTKESGKRNSAHCTFKSESIPELRINIGFSYGNGEYPLSYSGSSLEYFFEDTEDYTEFMSSLEIERWRSELREGQISITADDIKALGCTATAGSEYIEAVGRCYAGKLIEFYENAPEGSPMRCKELVLLKCERSLTDENGYLMLFAARPEDPFAMYWLEDGASGFFDISDAPDYYGWYALGGSVILTPHEDGSRSGRASLN